MAGAGLAISLAYLALDRFRYRRDVENVAIKLHGAYENDARLCDEATLEHLNELKWFCRKVSNGHSPAGALAWPYAKLYRSHGDVVIIALLAIASALTLVAGVAGEAELIQRRSEPWVIYAAFSACLAGMSLPGGSVVLGYCCRRWAIKRAEECDAQITHILLISARNAVITPEPNGEVAPSAQSTGQGKGRIGFFRRIASIF